MRLNSTTIAMDSALTGTNSTQSLRFIRLCVDHGKLLKQLWTMGIHDKKLLCILSAMLKAEVAGIGFPEVGTPQGGIISPLLSNVVLNELDWLAASQWEEIPTEFPYKETVNPNGSVSKSHKFSALRRTKLKEVTCVRYADDFKIFTNSYQIAGSMKGSLLKSALKNRR